MELRFDDISAQYLVMIPVKKYQFDWLSMNADCQETLLKYTVQHPLAVLNPPSLSYRRTFLKHIISHLEDAGVEIADGLYEAYTSLLSCQNEPHPFFYKTYLFPNCQERIVIRETRNVVSNGTTGLCTWPASLYCTEWCLQHLDMFYKKRILELGSGLGFLGLVLCCKSFPTEFTFSDCHEDVLEILSENVQKNIDLQDKSDANCSLRSCDSLDVIFTGELPVQLQCSILNIAKLDWNTVTQRDLQTLSSCLDIVIAADVIYDEHSISPLVNILSNLLLFQDSTCGSVFICCTKRNPRTIHQFLVACNDAGLSYTILNERVQHIFYYDRSVPIEILHIKKPESLFDSTLTS